MIRFRRLTPALLNAWLVNQHLRLAGWIMTRSDTPNYTQFVKHPKTRPFTPIIEIAHATTDDLGTASRSTGSTPRP
jgi:hypothetical protein